MVLTQWIMGNIDITSPYGVRINHKKGKNTYSYIEHNVLSLLLTTRNAHYVAVEALHLCTGQIINFYSKKILWSRKINLNWSQQVLFKTVEGQIK